VVGNALHLPETCFLEACANSPATHAPCFTFMRLMTAFRNRLNARPAKSVHPTSPPEQVIARCLPVRATAPSRQFMEPACSGRSDDISRNP